MKTKIHNKLSYLPVVAALVTGAVVACSSSDSETPGGAAGPADSTAAAVAGEPDTHCGTRSVAVDPAACNPEHEDEHHDDHADDAGAGDDHDQDAGATPKSEHAETLFNSEGYDEDCKYHVKWTSSAVRPNEDVNLQAVITTKADGKPVVGAPVSAEIFLDETHPAPNSGAKTTETAPGTYLIGPVRFDASGQWTVRFHIHGDCSGHGEASPHGHVAFFAKVP